MPRKVYGKEDRVSPQTTERLGGEGGKSPRSQPLASRLQPHRKPAPPGVWSGSTGEPGGDGSGQHCPGSHPPPRAPAAPSSSWTATGRKQTACAARGTASVRGRAQGEPHAVPTRLPPGCPFRLPPHSQAVGLNPCAPNYGCFGNRWSGKENGSIKKQLRTAKGWVTPVCNPHPSHH